MRPALTFVAATAFLLAGFTLAGSAIGLWDPVERQDSDSRAGQVGGRLHSDAVSRATPAVVNSKPSPPISVRSALLIALAASALSVLPGRGLRLAKRLEDLARSQTLSRPALPGRILRVLGRRATAKATMALLTAVVRAERARLGRAFSIPLRERSARALHEFCAEAVILTLAVGLAVAIGLLIESLLAGHYGG